MEKVILSCKKATYFLSLREEGKLSFRQSVQLKAHIAVCSMCRLFARQTGFIRASAPHTHEHSDHTLSESATNKLEKFVSELTEESKL